MVKWFDRCILKASYLWNFGVYALFFIEKLRQFTNVVGNLSHKGIARRALPASGGKDAVEGK